MAELKEGVSPKITWETRHLEAFDVVVNLDAQIPDVEGLVNRVGNGIGDWPSIEQKGTNKLFVDDLALPSLFAKKRYWSTLAGRRRLKTAYDPKSSNPATQSLMSEMVLSPRIKELMASEGATEIATRYGIDEFRYVEPLIGLVERNTKSKYMIYNFINGEILPTHYARYAGLVTEIIKFLSSNGIYPYDMVLDDNFILEERDGRKIAHLIDTEKFYRVNNLPKP